MVVSVVHCVVSMVIVFIKARALADNVIEALRCVTKLSEDEEYYHFITRVMTNPIAVKVKMNDLKDNMNPDRLGILTDKDIARMEKYRLAYERLCEFLR